MGNGVDCYENIGINRHANGDNYIAEWGAGKSVGRGRERGGLDRCEMVSIQILLVSNSNFNYFGQDKAVQYLTD